LVLDIEKMKENIESKRYLADNEPDKIIMKGALDAVDETCSFEHLNITNNIILDNIKDNGEIDDEYNLGF